MTHTPARSSGFPETPEKRTSPAINAIRERFASASAFIENYGDRQESELFKDAKALLAEVDRLRASVSPLLHEIADRVEEGREFRRGEWIETAPLEGVGRLPWTRKAWIEGIEISREVIARMLRDVADWEA
jgi:hypothetical protein